MPSKVNLVVLVLIEAICVARSSQELQICARSYSRQSEDLDRSMENGDAILDKKFINIQETAFPQSSENTSEAVTVTQGSELADEAMQFEFFNKARQTFENEKSQETARGRKKMDRMLMALLMAYKMKFIALIPTLIGTIVLLLASNALVGFFFALFASVVSMKGR